MHSVIIKAFPFNFTSHIVKRLALHLTQKFLSTLSRAAALGLCVMRQLCFLRGKLNLINWVLWRLQCVRHGEGEGDMSEREMDHLLVLCGFY
jgi:hypothetical protein